MLYPSSISATLYTIGNGRRCWKFAYRCDASEATTTQPRLVHTRAICKPGRMASHAMQRQSRNQLRIAIVEDGLVGEHVLHHHLNVREVEGLPQRLVAHAAASCVRQVAILHMKSRVRETVEIAGVIVMQMRQDDVGHLLGVHADQRAVRPPDCAAGRAYGESLLPARIRNRPGSVQSLRRSTQTK